jgi:exopolysaccharide biosynthesis polyprenyl glycosylphosphotransferase
VNATDRLELAAGRQVPTLTGSAALAAAEVHAVGKPEVVPPVGRPAPAWLAALEIYHGALNHPATLLIDALIVAGAFLKMGTGRAPALGMAAAFVIGGRALGVYRRRTSVESQGVRWYGRALLMTNAALVVASFVHPMGLSPRLVAESLTVATIWLVMLRAILWVAISAARRKGVGLRRALVIGTQGQIDQISHRLATYPEAGLRFAAGYTPTLPDTEAVEDGHAQAFSLLDRDEVDHVLFVTDGVNEAVFREFVYRADGSKAYTLVLPLPHLTGRGSRCHLGDLGVLPLPIGRTNRGLIAKRSFDVVMSALLILITSPVIGAACAATWLCDRGPVFFRQQRIGRNGRPFMILKLRSMVVGAEGMRDAYLAHNVNTGLLFKLHDDPRITPIGSLLRRFSIDELPQLFNVLKGDMSLVGPRPLPVGADEFEQREMGRHALLPGITGLWQVEGANALTYHDMIDLDLTYVVTRSFSFDLWLLTRTVPALLVRRSPC